MKYQHTTSAVFISRSNRFVAIVEIDGVQETVHVKNTGRCRELLQPGSQVILELSDNPNRKTRYDLICVYKEGTGWINIDSQVPNEVVKEWLSSGNSVFPELRLLKPEYTYGSSRVDFYLEYEQAGILHRVLLEVKGCTLEIDGIGYFPDAPTERGVKHLRELAGAVQEGYECYLAFVIAIPGVEHVHPNERIHPEFAAAFAEAQRAGVKVLYLPCEVQPDQLRITTC